MTDNPTENRFETQGPREVADGVPWLAELSNVVVFETGDDGAAGDATNGNVVDGDAADDDVADDTDGDTKTDDVAAADATDDDLRLACHLADYAVETAPDDPEVRAAATAVYDARAEREDSLMATNLYNAASAYVEDGRPFR